MPPRRSSTLLFALLSAACLAPTLARAFYMPPAFNLETVGPAMLDNRGVNDTDDGSVFAIQNRTAATCADLGEHCAETARLAARDVWDPRITAPDAGTVWTVGETVTVRW